MEINIIPYSEQKGLKFDFHSSRSWLGGGFPVQAAYPVWEPSSAQRAVLVLQSVPYPSRRSSSQFSIPWCYQYPYTMPSHLQRGARCPTHSWLSTSSVQPNGGLGPIDYDPCRSLQQLIQGWWAVLYFSEPWARPVSEVSDSSKGSWPL